ncbi:PAN/Apple domain containing protein [Trema orientale]|uniref:PAN/Apple domain containing protein n=1 Tax=Trema orientale TaxID=63057 RepID=A0A2P5E7E4_TREOI|nr:PAN/Apple domain containing protein [Trema orientale]
MDKQKGEFLKFSWLELPDTTNSWVNSNMNLKEYRAKCLSNCSCMAYSTVLVSLELFLGFFYLAITHLQNETLQRLCLVSLYFKHRR